MSYFADLGTANEGVLDNSTAFDIRIQPDDELMISVNSLIPEASAAFSLPTVNPSSMKTKDNAMTPTYQTYLVDGNGDIVYPIFGKLHIAGMTTEQLAEMLRKRIGETVDSPNVEVKLVNFKVNVLGEVKTPSVIEVNRKRFSVLDALAAAGDMTEFGKRDGVVIIREQDGQKVYHRLNLNSAEIVSSPYYYLKQNDVVYVEPNGIKQSNSRYNTYNSYKVTVISTVVSACSVIASLVIALCVKK